MADRLPQDVWIRGKRQGFAVGESHAISFVGPEELITGSEPAIVGHYVLADTLEAFKPEPVVIVRPFVPKPETP